MCLILFAWQMHPDYPLVLAANRDEFYNRPTAPAAFWEDAPDVLAGRDLQAGGTWMGVTRSGRFAAITNYRDPGNIKTNAPSRGELVSNFLIKPVSPQEYLTQLQQSAQAYNGFNLLVGNRETLWYYSNVEDQVRQVEPGVHGLSNHLLDTPWPKVQTGKTLLQRTITEKELNAGSLLNELKNTVIAADKELPQTGVGLELERALSPMFIATNGYGTRSSTVLLMHQNGDVTFSERAYQPPALTFEDRTFRW